MDNLCVEILADGHVFNRDPAIHLSLLLTFVKLPLLGIDSLVLYLIKKRFHTEHGSVVPEPVPKLFNRYINANSVHRFPTIVNIVLLYHQRLVVDERIHALQLLFKRIF